MVILCELLSVFCCREGQDRRLWSPSWDGVLSVASFYLAMSSGSSTPNLLCSLRKIRAPPRVVAFGWLTLCGSVLTMDNMRQRRMVMLVLAQCAWRGKRQWTVFFSLARLRIKFGVHFWVGLIVVGLSHQYLLGTMKDGSSLLAPLEARSCASFLF